MSVCGKVNKDWHERERGKDVSPVQKHRIDSHIGRYLNEYFSTVRRPL